MFCFVVRCARGRGVVQLGPAPRSVPNPGRGHAAQETQKNINSIGSSSCETERGRQLGPARLGTEPPLGEVCFARAKRALKEFVEDRARPRPATTQRACLTRLQNRRRTRAHRRWGACALPMGCSGPTGGFATSGFPLFFPFTSSPCPPCAGPLMPCSGGAAGDLSRSEGGRAGGGPQQRGVLRLLGGHFRRRTASVDVAWTSVAPRVLADPARGRRFLGRGDPPLQYVDCPPPSLPASESAGGQCLGSVSSDPSAPPP